MVREGKGMKHQQQIPERLVMRGIRQDCLDTNKQLWASTSSLGQTEGGGKAGGSVAISAREPWLLVGPFG